MNQRILELAEQAWDSTAVSPDFGHPVSFAEKFAELIVQECVQVCNNIDVEYEGEDVLATWCASAIKEHFGVKE
jgi:hypothetical protein